MQGPPTKRSRFNYSPTPSGPLSPPQYIKRGRALSESTMDSLMSYSNFLKATKFHARVCAVLEDLVVDHLTVRRFKLPREVFLYLAVNERFQLLPDLLHYLGNALQRLESNYYRNLDRCIPLILHGGRKNLTINCSLGHDLMDLYKLCSRTYHSLKAYLLPAARAAAKEAIKAASKLAKKAVTAAAQASSAEVTATSTQTATVTEAVTATATATVTVQSKTKPPSNDRGYELQQLAPDINIKDTDCKVPQLAANISPSDTDCKLQQLAAAAALDNNTNRAATSSPTSSPTSASTNFFCMSACAASAFPEQGVYV